MKKDCNAWTCPYYEKKQRQTKGKKTNYQQVSEDIKPYGRRKRLAIQYLYILSTLAWILLVTALGLSCHGWSIIIVLMPIVIFMIGFWNASAITVEVEDSVFAANYLSIGMLLVLPLLAWISQNYCGDKKRLLRIMIVAIILSMLSIVDIWIPKKWLSVVKHLKSVLQTASLALLIYALYDFLVSQCSNG